MKQIIKNLMKHTRHAELDSASHSVILRGAKNLNLPLTLTLSWICSTLTEFRQSCYATKGSICSLSGLVLLRPSANSLSLKGRGESVLCAIPTSKSIKVVPMSTDRATCVKHVPVPFKSSPTSTDRATCVAHDKNLSTCRLNVLKIDNTPTLSRICKFAFSSLTNSTLSQRERVKCPAFTLAETLITLGIIGVVAMLTIPNLVTKYQKRQTVEQLRVAMSILSQMLENAVEEHGDVRYWDNIDYLIKNNTLDNDARKAFVDKYFIPYLKGATPSEISGSNAVRLGYKTLPTQMNGSIVGMSSNAYYPVKLANGMLVFIGSSKWLPIHVDLNGYKAPNKYGKDLFIFSIDYDKNLIKPHNDPPFACKKSSGASLSCAYKIINDGWKIKDDYPW